jgi:hypothetical protein
MKNTNKNMAMVVKATAKGGNRNTTLGLGCIMSLMDG